MEIVVGFEDQQIEQDLARRREPNFWIYWRANGHSYPSDDWIDFGTVLLGWWTRVCDELAGGATSGSFAFMDGPYEILATRVDDEGVLTLAPLGEDYAWTTTLSDVIAPVSAAVTCVLAKLEHVPAADKQSRQLRACRDMLDRLGTVRPD